MTTLNILSESIAHILGDQFNIVLRENIKNSIVDLRAKFIRQDLDRNFLSYTDYLQPICLELEEIDRSYCPDFPTGCTILRSKQKIAKPLRSKQNGRISFNFVGSIDKKITFTFATLQELDILYTLPYQDDVIYYTYQDNRIFVLNNLKQCKIIVEEIVADPREIEDCSNPSIFKDNRKFPLPEDMIDDIKRAIIQLFRKPVQDGKEINIEKDVKD